MISTCSVFRAFLSCEIKMAAVDLRFLLLLRRARIQRYLLWRKMRLSLSRKKERRFWVRKIFAERKEKGEYYTLVRDLRLHDQEMFFRYFRMSPTTYEKLLGYVGADLKKVTTKMREPIGPDERLLITLRYLTTGDAHTTIGTNYRMSPTTVGRIINETCKSIWHRLSEQNYIKAPTTEAEWERIAEEFEDRWNFPHAIGAIDGKHVVMFAPAGSGSGYFNYKKTHSIVLLGVCDAKYKFILVDIGDSGRQSDGSVYHNSHLGFAIENKKLNIPNDCPIRHTNRVLPYVFVGDDAFGLKRHMMKPYPFTNLSTDKQIFNYRLSRARRVIENTFGIAASRFRVFYRPIIASADKVKEITKAVVALHNFLMTENELNNQNYCPPTYSDRDGPSGLQLGEWRLDEQNIHGLLPISNHASNHYSEDARMVRESYKEFFNNEGAVDWQWDRVSRTR